MKSNQTKIYIILLKITKIGDFIGYCKTTLNNIQMEYMNVVTMIKIVKTNYIDIQPYLIG